MGRVLIFDFDGTIADSFELALELAYELTGIVPVGDDELERLRHLPLLKLIRELHIPLIQAPKLAIKGRQMMHERLHEVKPFKGIPDVLATLHKNDNKLFVMSSNSEQNVSTFLKTHKLSDYFDGIYGGASIISKAASIRKVLRKNGLDIRDCFYIGDEVRDVIAARKVGVKPVAVAWGYQATEALSSSKPFALLENPKELLALFADAKV